MASYTGDQLSGAGVFTEALGSSSAHTFTFTFSDLLTGSQDEAYFTFETIRDSEGFYNSTSLTNASGSFSNEDKVTSLVSSPYIFSYVLTGSGASFDFQPEDNIPVSGAYLRTTGNVSLVIS